MHLSQLLKGAVVVTLRQNEAEVKCQMDIDSHISLTEQAGKIRFSLLGLWMKWGGQFSLEIVLLPHSVRGSCQLLLSRTDTFAFSHRVQGTVMNHILATTGHRTKYTVILNLMGQKSTDFVN